MALRGGGVGADKQADFSRQSNVTSNHVISNFVSNAIADVIAKRSCEILCRLVIAVVGGGTLAVTHPSSDLRSLNGSLFRLVYEATGEGIKT